MISSGKLYQDMPKRLSTNKVSNYNDLLEVTHDNIRKRDSFEVRNEIKSKLEKINIDEELGITSNVRDILDQIQDFEFDIFALSKETDGNEMILLTSYLMHKHDMYLNLAIDPVTFNKYISQIQNGYFDVAYHNKTHGADVGRLCYYYATNCELMKKANLNQIDL